MVTEAAAVTARAQRGLNTSLIGVGLLLAILIVAPFVLGGYQVLQLTKVLYYAVALFGLNLLTGFSGQISLGNGSFWALGSYTAVIMMTHAGLPYWVTPPIAAVVCFVVGYLFGRTATRLEGLYLALATFGLAIATPQILKLDVLEHWTGGSQGVAFTKPISPMASLSDDQWLYFFTFTITLVLFILGWNVIRGRTGRAFIALRDHPIAAATMGVDTVSYKSRAFGISAMYTGVAGAMDAYATGFVGPDSFPVALSIQLLVGSVLGGIGSLFGTLFGAVFVNVVPDIAKRFSDNAPAVLYGVLLIVFMMVMPMGMAGLVRTARIWLRRRLFRKS